jgi:hypothetical protein
MVLFVLKVLFKSIFLLLISEPTIDVFKKLKQVFIQYQDVDDGTEKKMLKKKVISHALAFLFVFAVYCVLVINFLE